MFTLVIVPSSEDEDDYTIMGIVVKPIHEYNVGKLDTYVHVKIDIHKNDNILFTHPCKVNKMSKTRFHQQILQLNLLHFLLLIKGPRLLQSP